MPSPSPDARPTLIGCPSCSGVLSVVHEHDTRHLQFVCSIGHAFSVQSLLEEKENQLETSLWSLMSIYEHIEMVVGYLLKQVDDGALPVDRQGLIARRDQARSQAKVIRQIIEETTTPGLDVAG